MTKQPIKRNVPAKPTPVKDQKLTAFIQMKRIPTEGYRMKASMELDFRIYSGDHEVVARNGRVVRPVLIKCFGLYTEMRITFHEEISFLTKGQLMKEGFEVDVERRRAKKRCDYGYITTRIYEAHYLINKTKASITRFNAIATWSDLDRVICKEKATWGNPAVDDNGNITYNKEGQVIRDPFAQSAKLELRKILKKERYRKDKMKSADKHTQAKGVAK